METNKQIQIIELPIDTTIYEWTHNEGKSITFPELLVGCEEVLYNNLDKVLCLTVLTHESGVKETVDFVVRREGIMKTLERIFGWATANQEYLMCARVLKLINKMEKDSELNATPEENT